MYHQKTHALRQTAKRKVLLDNYSISINYAEILENDSMEFMHQHPEYELIYVMDGTVSIRFDDEEKSEEQVKAGHFIFFNKNVKHYIQYNPSTSKTYFTILFLIKKIGDKSEDGSEKKSSHSETFDIFFKSIKDHDYIIYKDLHHSDRFINLMLDIVKDKRWGYEELLTMMYIAYIISLLSNFMTPCVRNKSGDINNIAIAFTTYLHEHYQDPNLSVQQLADNFYTSTRHVNRVFKEFFGTSPMKTLTTYRVNYAKSYIQDTDYSLETIAEKVGFSSASVLSRLFKEKEGMTISQYRETLKRK